MYIILIYIYIYTYIFIDHLAMSITVIISAAIVNRDVCVYGQDMTF